MLRSMKWQQRSHLLMAVFVLCVNELHARLSEEDAAYATSRLLSRIRPHDEVALATCGWHWDEFSHSWLKRLPRAATTWKFLEYSRLKKYVTRNMDNALMTNIVVHSLGKHASACVNPLFRSRLFVYAVEWILLKPDNESVNALSQYFFRTASRNFTCTRGRSSWDTEVKMTLSNGVNPVFFSRGCVERKGGPLIGKHSELRNTVIRAACIHLSHLRPANDKPNCNSYQSDVIFDAIKFYNVTVVQTFYPSADPLLKDMFEGTVDVHRNLAPPKAAAIRDFNFPGVIAYMHERFYVKRKGSVKLSLLDVVKDSKYPLMVICTAFILSMSFLVLANGCCLKRTTANDVSDSFMFLLAAVQATSYTIPLVGRWTVLGGLICGLWLVGMLPFSHYFRGEVMARLTFRAFPEHVDTLSELERALDERKVAPCVVRDTVLHYRLTTDHSDSSIHKKLRLVFRTHIDRDNLIKLSYGQCLTCALREDRICYSVSLPPWFRQPYKQMIVESKEHLSPILLTVTVRLNYPHKFGLREAISKIIESGLILPPEDTRRAIYLQNYEQAVSFEWSQLRFEELTSFLLLFISLLAFATVVCALEIIVHASISGTKDTVPEI